MGSFCSGNQNTTTRQAQQQNTTQQAQNQTEGTSGGTTTPYLQWLSSQAANYGAPFGTAGNAFLTASSAPVTAGNIESLAYPLAGQEFNTAYQAMLPSIQDQTKAIEESMSADPNSSAIPGALGRYYSTVNANLANLAQGLTAGAYNAGIPVAEANQAALARAGAGINQSNLGWLSTVPGLVSTAGNTFANQFGQQGTSKATGETDTTGQSTSNTTWTPSLMSQIGSLFSMPSLGGGSSGGGGAPTSLGGQFASGLGNVFSDAGSWIAGLFAADGGPIRGDGYAAGGGVDGDDRTARFADEVRRHFHAFHALRKHAESGGREHHADLGPVANNSNDAGWSAGTTVTGQGAPGSAQADAEQDAAQDAADDAATDPTKAQKNPFEDRGPKTVAPPPKLMDAPARNAAVDNLAAAAHEMWNHLPRTMGGLGRAAGGTAIAPRWLPRFDGGGLTTDDKAGGLTATTEGVMPVVGNPLTVTAATNLDDLDTPNSENPSTEADKMRKFVTQSVLNAWQKHQSPITTAHGGKVNHNVMVPARKRYALGDAVDDEAADRAQDAADNRYVDSGQSARDTLARYNIDPTGWKDYWGAWAKATGIPGLQGPDFNAATTRNADLLMRQQELVGDVFGTPTMAKRQLGQAADIAGGIVNTPSSGLRPTLAAQESTGQIVDPYGTRTPSLASVQQAETTRRANLPTVGEGGYDSYGRPIKTWINPNQAPESARTVGVGTTPIMPAGTPAGGAPIMPAGTQGATLEGQAPGIARGAGAGTSTINPAGTWGNPAARTMDPMNAGSFQGEPVLYAAHPDQIAKVPAGVLYTTKDRLAAKLAPIRKPPAANPQQAAAEREAANGVLPDTITPNAGRPPAQAVPPPIPTPAGTGTKGLQTPAPALANPTPVAGTATGAPSVPPPPGGSVPATSTPEAATTAAKTPRPALPGVAASPGITPIQATSPFNELGGLQGKEFMDRLTEIAPPQAEVVRKILNGQISLGEVNSRTYGTMAPMIHTWVSQADPNFTVYTSAARNQAVKAMGPGGKNTETFQNAGTAIGHLARLYELLPRLNNANYGPDWTRHVTGTVNEYLYGKGPQSYAAAVAEWNEIAPLAALELGKVATGGHPAEGMVAKILAPFDPYRATGELQSALKGAINMMDSRLVEATHTWNNAFANSDKEMPNARGWLDPEHQRMLNHIEGKEGRDAVIYSNPYSNPNYTPDKAAQRDVAYGKPISQMSLQDLINMRGSEAYKHATQQDKMEAARRFDELKKNPGQPSTPGQMPELPAKTVGP